jgi:coenzyme F420 hydrogenase subunit beta
LLSVDFTNELTDVSVGDAWHPHFESIGEGFSVVIARTAKAEALLNSMQADEKVILDQISLDDALSMHGHMLDFKKRGAFVRIQWRKTLRRPVPDYGYLPVHIPLSRKLVEGVISGLFVICQTRIARWIIEFIPINIVGPLFDVLRKFWKNISKPTKRKGLLNTIYRSTDLS